MDFEIQKVTADEPYLQAMFHEIEHRKAVCKNGGSNDYRIYQLPLRFSQKLKFHLPLTCTTFKNYDEVEQYIKEINASKK